jgi:hypothetical protein
VNVIRLDEVRARDFASCYGDKISSAGICIINRKDQLHAPPMSSETLMIENGRIAGRSRFRVRPEFP